MVEEVKQGRPTKYQGESTCDAAEQAARLGATDLQLATVLSVSIDTITQWKKEHEEFSLSIKKGKAFFDDNCVESSLLKRAMGMKRMVQRITKDGDIIDTYEELPPDPTSMIFWLKNRRREYWKDRQAVEHSGTLGLRPLLEITSHQPKLTQDDDELSKQEEVLSKLNDDVE